MKIVSSPVAIIIISWKTKDKTGDNVRVIAGEHKGAEGKVTVSLDKKTKASGRCTHGL
jgi:hypothetical protein